ncbi:general transcription factor 3C polypeptide 1 isoform X2 [Leptinotarsa decemlineata]|uniref:general transcription factor 3C polypeptide 1 isoform X2 n=1 Tax=Leptinotarsa decemlineata TaxID=7539 RepID=UPI003D30A50A
MGKQIETKYSNASHNVLKKSSTKEKNRRPKKLNISDSEKGPSSPNCKRKNWGMSDIKEPPSKIPKLSAEYIGNDENPPLDHVKTHISWNIPDDNEIAQNKVTIEYSKNLDKAYLKEEDAHRDLFFVDELRNGYFNFITKDFYFHVIDEICLEGLDGITLEALWKRLLTGLDGPLDINQNLKRFMWKIMKKNAHIEFYELPQPRKELLIYDRFKYLNTEIGVVMELAYELPELYPLKIINDPNVSGSCSTFEERNDISDVIRSMSYEEVETFGQKLVIVASQYLRTQALLGELSDPCIEMQSVEYCILERIGRSRRLGELTQGNMSISSFFKMDPKSVFHYKKVIYSNNLISKQFFYIKSVVTDQNKIGRLLQLRRFHTPIKLKPLVVTEKVVDMLRKQPGYRMDVNELREIFGSNYTAMLKIFKSSEFRKFVKTDAVYNYRFIYPDAKKSEYMNKSRLGEKIVRCFELKNPYMNVTASWSKELEDSDEDDEDEDIDSPSDGKIFNEEILKDAYYHISMLGKEGCSMKKLKKLISVDSNSCRRTLKKLHQKRILDVEKCDAGKQRTSLYYASCAQREGNFPSPGTAKKVISKVRIKQKIALLKSNQGFYVERDPIKEQKQVLINTIPMFLQTDSSQIHYNFLVQKCSAGLNLPISEEKNVDFNFTFTRNIVNLKYREFVCNKFLSFKDILELNIPVLKRIVKVNFENACTSKMDTDWVTKLVLLKATFGEIYINSESLCLVSRKRKYLQIEIPKFSDEVALDTQLKPSDQKLAYMGDNPVIVYEEKDGEVDVQIVSSSIPTEYNLKKKYAKKKSETDRVAIRIQIILNQINEKKVIEDIFRLTKIIIDEEMKDGYQKKIDRKSLARILKILMLEGYIKIYKVTISNNILTRTIVFICHPSISHTDDLIQTSVQQLKWRHFIGSAKKNSRTNIRVVQKKVEETMKSKVHQSPFSETDVMNSINELKKVEKHKFKEPIKKVSRRITGLYGFKPKFVRMKIMHEFMFYLIYEYKTAVEPLNTKEVKDLFKSYHIELSEEDLEQLPKIYTKEISWKMFIPTLPLHEGWDDGWAFMCDIILRIPVSVLCKVHACFHESADLLQILHHPIKRFYLVKDLPQKVRNVLLNKRKYLYSVHECILKLSQCGLLQFGPRKHTEKDQLFIHLNRRASILNTTSSEPAYHKIENKDYPQIAFFFNSQTDVNDYWYNLNTICVNTKLNARKVGELVTVIDSSIKPELAKCSISKTPEEAKRDDNGDIPGDKRGAAGLDSSLYSHLVRNWFWASRKKGDVNPEGLKEERLKKILPEIKPFKNLGSSSKSRKVFLHKTVNVNSNPKIGKKLIQIPVRSSSKKYTRKITEHPKKLKKCEYYDKLDRTILKRIGRNRRVQWSPKEDTILMLCRAGDLFLYGERYKKKVVSYQVIRDVLHSASRESHNKTSRSIQRRLKKHTTYPFNQIEKNLHNLHQLQPISDYFSLLANYISSETDETGAPFKLTDAQIHTAYVILMSVILKHKKEVFDVLQGNTIKVDYLSKQNLDYTEKESVEIDKTSLKFEDPKNEDDIKKNVLKSVIHSSLTSKDKTSAGLQLLKVYQKYPDQLIRESVEELKQTNTISCKKYNVKKTNIWQAPFHLSQCYIFYQYTTFNITSAVEAYKTYLALRHESQNEMSLSFSEVTVNTKRYGQLLGMNEFRSFWNKLRYEFDLPQSVIILNPCLSDHEEVIHELAVRFQLKLKKLQKENKESDQDIESESLRTKFSNDSNLITNKEGKLSPAEKIMHNSDIQNTHQDLADDNENTDEIDRLKTWVANCMKAEMERSPSPEFMEWDETLHSNVATEEPVVTVDHTLVSSEQDFENNDASKESSMIEKKVLDRVPTLEEIKEEMLRLGSSEDRRIPYITDLSDLLNKENFGDIPTDEKTLKRLKNHFITQYASLQKVIVEDLEYVPENILNIIEDKLKIERIWNKVENSIVVHEVLSFEEVAEMLEKLGGTQEDIDLMQEIMEFVSVKKIFGASGQQIKERFSAHRTNMSLAKIIEVLVEAGILLQTGICTIVFVHYKYRSYWLAETYQITTEDQNAVMEIEEKEIENQEVFQNKLSRNRLMMVKIMPWNKIDGSLNKETLTIWLCSVLSHCLEYPKLPFLKLCEKFCYLKPVDIYYCLEILQDLGCLSIRVYEGLIEQTLYSEWKKVNERPATILDDFEYCSIEPHNISMTCLGSFLYDYQQTVTASANICN